MQIIIAKISSNRAIKCQLSTTFIFSRQQLAFKRSALVATANQIGTTQVFVAPASRRLF